MDENAYSKEIILKNDNSLTLNILIYFENYKRYIHTWNRILDLSWSKYIK